MKNYVDEFKLVNSVCLKLFNTVDMGSVLDTKGITRH